MKGRPRVFREQDKIVKNAQAQAEQTMLKERPDIVDLITAQKLMKSYQNQGRIDDAVRVGRDAQTVEKVLNIRK